MQKLFLLLSLFIAHAAAAEVDNPNIDSIIESQNDQGKIPVGKSDSQDIVVSEDVVVSEDTVVSENRVESSPINTHNTQQLQQLANHAQWHHLLFYKNGKAEVISEGFYLSHSSQMSSVNFSPYDELTATLNKRHDPETVCRFPARYLWLSQQLTEVSIDLTFCQDLPDPNQKISLVLVSNYLKNPASSFGHVLVKTNANSEMYDSNSSGLLSSEDLLNNAYNFGARIPPNENGLMYAIKGLFGIYNAGFSEAEFFKQDAVYSKSEQRDMWEYVLNLDEFETQLLNYHLYEAKSARFDYYFIKQNCAYRSGELLELISNIDTTKRLGPWYAPDYVFDQLIEYNDQSIDPIIGSVRYLPSEQTQLRHKFLQLSRSMQNIINKVIVTEDLVPIMNLNDTDKALALDFLILHRTYKISQNDTLQNQAFKRQLLSQRFLLPESHELANLTVPNKPSPALSNKTTQTKISFSDDRASLGLSLFVKDPLNSYTDINKRFEAVQATVGYDFNDENWKLTDFVFLDMHQIEDLRQPLADEPKLSWQLKTGARTDPFNGDSHSPYLQGGLGAGALISENFIGYTMLNASIHDQDTHFDAGIEIGLRLKRQNQGAELSFSKDKRDGMPSISSTKLTLRQQISKNNDLRVLVTYKDNDPIEDMDGMTSGVAWHHYW